MLKIDLRPTESAQLHLVANFMDDEVERLHEQQSQTKSREQQSQTKAREQQSQTKALEQQSQTKTHEQQPKEMESPTFHNETTVLYESQFQFTF